jgi:hypothetical protein
MKTYGCKESCFLDLDDSCRCDQLNAPDTLYPGTTPWYPMHKCWVGLGNVQKIFHLNLEPLVSQAVASSYNDYATEAL